MKNSKNLLLLLLIGFFSSSGIISCGGDEEDSSERGIGALKKERGGSIEEGDNTPRGKSPVGGVSPSTTSAMTNTPSGEDNNLPPLILEPLSTESFVESDSQRDPFKPYFYYIYNLESLLISEREYISPKKIVAENYDLSQLVLAGIVSYTSGTTIKAMLIDPEGNEWIVQRGDYVGKGEAISISAGKEIRVYWRVSRIDPIKEYIVFERIDPTVDESVPPLTKIMYLHPELEATLSGNL